MNNNILDEYKKNCSSLLYLKDQEKEICENIIKNILIEEKNFEIIKFILLEEENAQLKLITIESLKKTFENLHKTKTYEKIRLKDEKSKKEEEKKIEYLKKLNIFFYEYLISIDLSKTPKFIINSLSNCFAENMIIFLSRGISLKDFKIKIKESMALNQKIETTYITILIFDFLITNLLINPSEYAYIQYKKMVLNFKSEFLLEIMEVAHNTIKKIISISDVYDLKNLEVLKSTLDLYYKGLTFPFNISYNGYNSDANLEEITLTLFPKEYVQFFTDFTFFDFLFKILEVKLSNDISLKVARILSRICSTRCSIFTKDILQKNFRQKCIQGFIIVIEFCEPSIEILNEIIEYLSRLISLFGISFILSCKDLFANFENKTELLSNRIIRISLRLEDPIFYKLTYYWKKIKPNYKTLNSEQKILNFLTNYCHFFFLENNDINFFNEEMKSAKKFESLIEQRFMNMRDLFQLNKISIFTLITKSFESLMNFSNNLNQENINIFLTRLGHFLLLYTYCILKPDSYYSHHHFALESEVEEKVFLEKMGFICINIFRVIAKLSNFVRYSEIDIYRGYEMSLNYFINQLGYVIIEKQIYNVDLDTLYSQKENLGSFIIGNDIFENAEKFLIKICQKLLSNFEYQDKMIIQHSLKVLRQLTEKIKKIYKGKKRKIILLEQICQNLIKTTNQYLTINKFFKLRMLVYEIIGICYLDDYHDNYIENSHMIIAQIITNNTTNNSQVNLKRLFYDVLGIYKATYLSKITITFTKISYPKVQNLLQSYGENLLSDNSFIATLIEFYKVLMENTSTKYSVNQSQVIMFRIITDSCRMVSALLKQINGVLENLTVYEQKLSFVTNNHKLVKRFLEIFDVLIKYSDVSFSIFHFFGNDLFIDFIKNIHKFIFLISDCVFFNFPKEKKKILDVLQESSDNLSDLIIEFFDEKQINELLEFVLNFFSKHFEKGDQKTINLEQTFYENISNILKQILNSIYEYMKIYINDSEKNLRIKKIIDFTYETAKKFALKIIGLNILYPYLNKHRNNFSTMIYYIAIVYKDNGLFENFVEEISKDCFYTENVNNGVFNSISKLGDNVEFNLVKSNLETFQNNYSKFIEDLLKIFKHDSLRKNSYTYYELD